MSHSEGESVEAARQVEVYQLEPPIEPEEMDDADRERFLDLSHGMSLDGVYPTLTEFGRFYNLVGAEYAYAAPDKSDERILSDLFARWNNNDGLTDTSREFARANGERRAVSLSVGHIVRIDGTAYYCDPVGWTELDL